LVHHVNDSDLFVDDDNGWRGEDDSGNSEESYNEEEFGNTVEGSSTTHPKFGIIPKFRHIYEVKCVPVENVLTQEEEIKQHCRMLVLKCPCKYHMRMGIPCRYMASIIKSIENLFKIYFEGFPPASVMLCWLLLY